MHQHVWTRHPHCVDLNSGWHSAAGCSCHAWCISNTAALKWMPFHAPSRFDWHPAKAMGGYTPLSLHLNDIHGLRCLLSLAVQIVVASGSWLQLFPAKAELKFSRQIHFNCLFSPLLVKFIWTVKCQTLVMMRQFHWAAEWIKRLSYTRVGWQVPLKKAHAVKSCSFPLQIISVVWQPNVWARVAQEERITLRYISMRYGDLQDKNEDKSEEPKK